MPKFAASLLAFAVMSAGQAPGSRVEGHVTSTTGEALKNAVIELRSEVASAARLSPGQPRPAATVYNALSDASGHFAIDCPPGDYSASAQRTGYFQQAFSSQITVDRSQPAARIVIELTPEARIEGKITDEDGDPVPRAFVSINSWSSLQGTKVLSTSAQIEPGGDGSFVVGGLREGYYYVCASPIAPPGRPKGVSAHQSEIATCSPSSTDLASATLIKVTPGAVIRGVDIRMRTAAVYSFKGHLAEPAVAAIQLTPSGAHPLLFAARTGLTLPDGSFEVYGLSPGTYRIEARLQSKNANTPGARRFAVQEITIGREDIQGVALHLAPGFDLAGKITMENGSPAPPPRSRSRVSLVTMGGLGVGQIIVGADGTFSVWNVPPERYRLLVTGAIPGSYVKSVTLGDQNVANRVIDLSAGVPGDLKIVLSPHAGEISGSIPGKGIQVAAWRPGQDPADASTVVTDGSGQFRFGDLAPGEYRVAAWQAPGPLLFPEFLKQFESAAATVKLGEDESRTVEPPMIARESIEAAMANVR